MKACVIKTVSMRLHGGALAPVNGDEWQQIGADVVLINAQEQKQTEQELIYS